MHKASSKCVQLTAVNGKILKIIVKHRNSFNFHENLILDACASDITQDSLIMGEEDLPFFDNSRFNIAERCKLRITTTCSADHTSISSSCLPITCECKQR